MTPEVVITGDGSSTLFHSGTGEHYHSTFGAITESMHVFIESGLRQIIGFTGILNVLEIGFGTGLNALLTLAESEKHRFTVEYDAIEPWPLATETTSQLNYPEILGGPEFRVLFDRLHAAPCGSRCIITDRFSLLKICSGLEVASLPSTHYQLVYFDAFSPNVQPELWQPDIFRKLFSLMKPGGLLLTYCSKGDVARGMKEAGFTVVKIGGPPGKRHMLRAVVPSTADDSSLF